MPNLRGASPVGRDGGKAVRTRHRRTAEIDQVVNVSVTAGSWVQRGSRRTGGKHEQQDA